MKILKWNYGCCEIIDLFIVEICVHSGHSVNKLRYIFLSYKLKIKQFKTEIAIFGTSYEMGRFYTLDEKLSLTTHRVRKTLI